MWQLSGAEKVAGIPRIFNLKGSTVVIQFLDLLKSWCISSLPKSTLNQVRYIISLIAIDLLSPFFL